MKTVLRTIAIFSFALYFLPGMIPGLTIEGGFPTLILGGVCLALLFLVLKPILNIISFPVNLVTLGIFSIFTNALILYLLTIFISDITISAFTYQKAEVFGFITPVIVFNTFFAYVYTAFVLATIDAIVNWLVK